MTHEKNNLRSDCSLRKVAHMSSKSNVEKREAVVEAALDMFAERGFHGAPTSLIAERAGVGVGTIYRYFRNKEELIHCVFDEMHQRFHQRFPESLGEDVSLQERLTLLLGQLLAIFIESPREFRYLEQYHYSPFADLERPEIPPEEHNAIGKLLGEGRDAGLFREGPLPVLQAVALGPIISLAKEHIAGRLTVDETTVQLAAEACWEALLKR